MQLKWGTASFDVNSVWPSVTREALRTGADVPYAIRTTVQITGYLSAVGQTALMLLESSLKTALSVNYRDLVFYADDGASASPAITLLASACLNGPIVIAGPSFTNPEYGAEYATQRKFSFTVQADYALTAGPLLFSFRESVTYGGGLPKYVCRPALNGPSQRQLTYLLMPFRCVQEGEAVGYLTYPEPPPPLFPKFRRGDDDPKRIQSAGRQGQSYQGFPVSWSYTFEAPGPFFSLPNQWPLLL